MLGSGEELIRTCIAGSVKGLTAATTTSVAEEQPCLGASALLSGLDESDTPTNVTSTGKEGEAPTHCWFIYCWFR